MLVKFEQKSVIQTTQKFELFEIKWLTIFNNALTLFWKTFLYLKQLFDAKLLIWNCQLSVAQKLIHWKVSEMTFFHNDETTAVNIDKVHIFQISHTPI